MDGLTDLADSLSFSISFFLLLSPLNPALSSATRPYISQIQNLKNPAFSIFNRTKLFCEVRSGKVITRDKGIAKCADFQKKGGKKKSSEIELSSNKKGEKEREKNP